jgi:hypothetical protein
MAIMERAMEKVIMKVEAAVGDITTNQIV